MKYLKNVDVIFGIGREFPPTSPTGCAPVLK